MESNTSFLIEEILKVRDRNSDLFRWLHDLVIIGDSIAEASISELLKGRILDIGCGAGELVKGLVERGYDAYGIDNFDVMQYEPYDYHLCWKHSGIGDKSIKASWGSMPFKNNEFSIVTAKNVLFYKSRDIEPNYQEVRRVLKPGGIFYMIDGNIGELLENTRRYNPNWGSWMENFKQLYVVNHIGLLQKFN